MATSSRIKKVKRGFEMLVKVIEWKAPNFKLVPVIVKSLNHSTLMRLNHKFLPSWLKTTKMMYASWLTMIEFISK